MEKEAIIEVLGEWNFWGKELEIGMNRGETKEAIDLLRTGKIIALTGIRRAGKSTLLKQIARDLIADDVGGNNILIMNFEEVRFDEELNLKFLLKAYDAFLEILKPSIKPYIFLDEIQEIDRWEKFARSLNEKNEAFIIVTGSSSKIMSEELATLLTGRSLSIEIFPLSFKEFLNFRGVGVKDKLDVLTHARELRRLLREYMHFGGFPEIVLEENDSMRERILKGYFTDIITKDIVKRFRIKDMGKMEFLANYYLTNSSSLITFNRISRFLKIPVKTVERYSKYLEISRLIFFIKRFSFSLKEQENSPRKVYAIDPGFPNVVGFKFMEGFGKLTENVVAIHLLRRYGEGVFYWKDLRGEVDFVVKEGLRVTKLIQVCWDISDEKTKEREIKSLLKAMDEFRLKKGLVITEDFEEREEIKGKTITYKPLWKWLLEK